MSQPGDSPLEQTPDIVNFNKKNNRQSLSQVKKAKQQVDDDARLLANRIALLKQEEIKTIKKIEETKRKAYQIFKAKQQNELRQLERQKYQEFILRRQDDLKKYKEQGQLQKDNRKQVWQQVKNENSDQIKQMRQEHKKIKEKNQQDYLNLLKQKNKTIKQQREQGRQKIDDFQNHKRYVVQKEFARQYEMEEHKRKQRLEEIQKMEKLEWDLIQKLQHTQSVQRMAYKELEDAIQLSAGEFESNFIKKDKESQ